MNTALKRTRQNKKCKFIKKTGDKCQTWALANSEYCYFHNPDISEADKQKARQRSGGREIVVYKSAEVKEPFTGKTIKLKQAADVTRFYSKLINDVFFERMDLQKATGLGYLLNGLLKSLEISELSERMENIEKFIEKSEAENK